MTTLKPLQFNATTPTTIEIVRLRPTQITVGMLQVKQKRTRIRALEKQPSELVAFILRRPIRVVLGPKKKAYVIDHHHLGLALIKERFVTAPMHVEGDFSALSEAAFWRKMKALGLVHPYDAKGKQKKCADIPNKLTSLKDDPYRSLAGFVRETGGFAKVTTPYAEFEWVEFYRRRIKEKLLDKHFNKALKRAMTLASHRDARKLPGFVKTPAAKRR